MLELTIIWFDYIHNDNPYSQNQVFLQFLNLNKVKIKFTQICSERHTKTCSWVVCARCRGGPVTRGTRASTAAPASTCSPLSRWARSHRHGHSGARARAPEVLELAPRPKWSTTLWKSQHWIIHYLHFILNLTRISVYFWDGLRYLWCCKCPWAVSLSTIRPSVLPDIQL